MPKKNPFTKKNKLKQPKARKIAKPKGATVPISEYNVAYKSKRVYV